MKIEISKSAGFCFGVSRAVEMANRALEEKRKPVYSIGSLIHNPLVKKELEEKGYKLVEKPEEVAENSIFVVRSHGIAKNILENLKRREIEIVDATCPFVRRAQRIAEKFYESGKQVVIFGDRNHAEVIGINSWTNDTAIIVGTPDDVEKLLEIDSAGLLSQTTQKKEKFEKVISALKKKVKNIFIENTICLDTSKKQEEVNDLAKRSDLMIIIGGKDSSNTTKLAEIAKSCGKPTYHIENENELEEEWFKNIENVGIAAGASTPQKIIDRVVENISNIKL